MKVQLVIFFCCTVKSVVEAQLPTAAEIIALSSCEDISEIGFSTILVPPTYPNGLQIHTPRGCRFETRRPATLSATSNVLLQALLGTPLQLGPRDSIVITDWTTTDPYPQLCNDSSTSTSQPALRVTSNTPIQSSLSFSSTVGSNLLIDFCTTGSNVPVAFSILLSLVPLTTPSLPTSAISPWPVGFGDVELSDQSGASAAFRPQGSRSSSAASSPSSSAVQCGVTSNPPGRSRIVNGWDAQPGNFPWTVAFVHKVYKQFCGGSIMNAYWIITAAHCIIGPLKMQDIIANTTVVIGSLNLQTAGPNNKFYIDQIAVHPLYDPTGWLNDVALVKLKNPITNFAHINVKPICLPNQSLAALSASLPKGSMCYTAGWGYKQEGAGTVVNLGHLFQSSATSSSTQLGAGSDILQFAKQDYVDLKTCQQNYFLGNVALQSRGELVRDNMVCAQNYALKQGVCLGDSGGGLYCKEADGSWSIYGISSWSAGCARKDLPSVFSNVFQLRSFVDRVINR
ncbi:hypothetical protein RvY_03199 [Ramazzottius varieornatus]|uniref:Peptidase S1 domain-containing protein n=1 Tax=Ramazzottius varieornatus TaxID=947166 RepID=A0A1D1UU98_RAMVA|nr:hypothetical protein RvY_03199 [Ramazzottius varieornatus]